MAVRITKSFTHKPIGLIGESGYGVCSLCRLRTHRYHSEVVGNWNTYHIDPNPEKTVTYEGAVLGTYERNGYDDSDFYAVVWDADEQRLRTVEYATTRAATYGNSASADVTDEVLAEVREWARGQLFGRYDLRRGWDRETASVDREVRVTRGRKVPKGTEGRVVGRGQSYNQWERHSEWRVGIETTDGERVFIPEAYVEVLNAESYGETDEVLREQADRVAETMNAAELANLIRVVELRPGFVLA